MECLLLLLLSHLSCVWLCATPETAAHQAPPSLEFSRQEHWSGLPFPSPMHESEKWKWSRSVMSDLVTPWTAAYQAPPSMGFARQEYWSGVPLPSPFPSPRSLVISAFLSVDMNLPILGTSYKCNIQYFSFCVWLISFSIMFSGSIHVVTCIRILVLFYSWIVF